MCGKENVKEIRYFPVKSKDGSYLTICGIPVFTFSNEKGKRVSPKVNTMEPVDRSKVKALPVRADFRLIPKIPKFTKIFDDNIDLTRIEVSISNSRYYMVPFVAPNFLGNSNFKLARAWIADSLISTPSNNYGPNERALTLDLLLKLCDECEVAPNVKKAVSVLAMNEIVNVTGWGAVKNYHGMSVSMIQYTSAMRAILSVVLKMSPKALSLSEYKICKPVTKKDIRIVKRAKKLVVPDEEKKGE